MTLILAIVSRRTRAGVPAVVSLTTIQGGVKENVIAEHVEVGGTVRNAGPGQRTALLVTEGYPVTHNDTSVTTVIREVAASLLGPEKVVDLPSDTWRKTSAT